LNTRNKRANGRDTKDALVRRKKEGGEGERSTRKKKKRDKVQMGGQQRDGTGRMPGNGRHGFGQKLSSAEKKP